ncbi:MAG: phosphoenolpyruvate synthase [Streptosporangiales bacterium]|nr:phosphoenolpyruvate synthase [Streptosporangiales bacterium]
MTNPYLVRSLADIGIDDRPTAGGKGASLGELTRAGLRVPPGCLVTTSAFERAVQALDPAGAIRREIESLAADAADDADDYAAVARVTADIRRRIEMAALPEDLCAAIAEGYRALHREPDDADAGAPVAVRSSATGEDSGDASFAGLQDTYLWVRGADAVVDHVRRCWASLYSVESVSYRLRRNLPERGLAMAVVIQRMVDPRCSGVMFTRSPSTGDRSVIAIEASWGLGSAIVSGDVTPDTYVVSKVTGEIVKRSVSSKLRQHRMNPGGAGAVDEAVPADLQDRPCLSDDEIRLLADLGRRVENHYGAPQDIEWAISGAATNTGENVFVLQSRPETVWAGREKGPVAMPKGKAFQHVFDRLGGAAR